MPLQKVGQNNTSKGGFIVNFSEGTKTKSLYLNTWAKFAEDLILKVGNLVEVDFEVDSRQWKDKWFTEATARSVSNISGSATAQSNQVTATQAAASKISSANESFRVQDNPNDDPLPF